MHKPHIGDVYEIPSVGAAGRYRIVSIGSSPYTPGRYKRIGMRWLGVRGREDYETGATTYTDTKQMRKHGMKLLKHTQLARSR